MFVIYVFFLEETFTIRNTANVRLPNRTGNRVFRDIKTVQTLHYQKRLHRGRVRNFMRACPS